MGKRSWIAGAVGLCLGLALGSTATFFWMRSGSATDPGQGNQDSVVPEPSEQDARASFQNLLSEAGVDAEVVQFRRTDWFLNTVTLEPVDVGNGQFELKPSAKPYKTYHVAYEAELVFRGNSQIKENFVLMWSPGNSVSGQVAAMTTHETASLRKGEQKQVRGRLGYKQQGNQWKLQPDITIDAGR